MEKIELGTSDGTAENIERIAELFPQVVTEVKNAYGELERVVDFDALRDLLGDVAEDMRERYQFTWPGKREAKAEARRSIYKTMIPELSKSKDWHTTENVYIEGDNLDALKILKETYAGKVKLIYIDPPYNTGHDFVYDDDFAKTRSAYEAESGDYDEEGGRLVANTEGNGRFHSDWCSMMYPRMLLARDLLASDGAIFISIDDNESSNLRKICDEVFGVACFVGFQAGLQSGWSVLRKWMNGMRAQIMIHALGRPAMPPLPARLLTREWYMPFSTHSRASCCTRRTVGTDRSAGTACST